MNRTYFFLLVITLFVAACSDHRPPKSVFESPIYVRDYVDDVGGFTVGQFVSVIEEMERRDPEATRAKGWKKLKDRYEYSWILTTGGIDTENQFDFIPRVNYTILVDPSAPGADSSLANLGIYKILHSHFFDKKQ